MKSWYLVGLAAILIAAGGAYFVWNSNGFSEPSGANPDVAATVALGEELYAEYCASCHGADLEGEPNWRRRLADGTFPAPPHDESGHTWHHGDEFLFRYTKHGGAAFTNGRFRSAMPGFGDQLSDREIWAIISYIKSQWPPRIRRAQEQRDRR